MLKLACIAGLSVALILARNSLLYATPECLLHPEPGHQVDIVDIHPSDKQFFMLKELKTVKMILMTPGACINHKLIDNDGPWYRARLFILQTNSKSFSRRGVISIEAGKLK